MDSIMRAMRTYTELLARNCWDTFHFIFFSNSPKVTFFETCISRGLNFAPSGSSSSCRLNDAADVGIFSTLEKNGGEGSMGNLSIECRLKVCNATNCWSEKLGKKQHSVFEITNVSVWCGQLLCIMNNEFLSEILISQQYNRSNRCLSAIDHRFDRMVYSRIPKVPCFEKFEVDNMKLKRNYRLFNIALLEWVITSAKPISNGNNSNSWFKL